MPKKTLLSGPLQTERQADGRRLLLRDLVVSAQEEEIAVPEQTVSDFSSIPWFGRMTCAGVALDFRRFAISRAVSRRSPAFRPEDFIRRLCA